MKWNELVDPVEGIDIQSLNRLIDSTSTESYCIVDVRQPAEYTKGHIPGALSMPLNDLLDGRLDLPDPVQLIVYSRQGARSKAAIQWFQTQGFADVKELIGGFENWKGNRAFGTPDLNLDIVKQDVAFADAVSMAYAMEEGLRQFYLEISRRTDDPVYQKLYRKLASFEVEHKQTLADMYRISERKDLISKEKEIQQAQLLEGGGQIDESLIGTLANTTSVYDVFSLAIAFETQAFDFYVRLARNTVNPETRTFFLEMADAEKEHLAFVTGELDRYLEDA